VINCQLCFKPTDRFGTLIDPSGHKWLICSVCINTLWQNKQALNQTVTTGISSDGLSPNGLVSMLKLAKETGCECSVCLALTLGAEIAGYDVSTD
jgi:hypothetical protein